MIDSTTQSASPPVKIYHGSEIIPTVVGTYPSRDFGGMARTADFFCESREHFSPREKEQPPSLTTFLPPCATRYDDTSLCMGKQSKMCEKFETV
jgi:hypothetical protein